MSGKGGGGGWGVFMAKEAHVFRSYNDPLMQVWVFHPVSRDDRRRIQLLQDYKSISVHPLCASGICTLEKFFENLLFFSNCLLLKTFEVLLTLNFLKLLCPTYC